MPLRLRSHIFYKFFMWTKDEYEVSQKNFVPAEPGTTNWPTLRVRTGTGSEVVAKQMNPYSNMI